MEAHFRVLFQQESGYLNPGRSQRFVVALECWRYKHIRRYIFIEGLQYVGGEGVWEWDEDAKREVWKRASDAHLIRRAIKRYDAVIEQYEAGECHD